jgi:hypothetical protein
MSVSIDLVILIVAVVVLILMVLIYYSRPVSFGFQDDSFWQKYEYAKYLHENDRLTFKNLRKGCDTCTNVDYSKFKSMIEEGK